MRGSSSVVRRRRREEEKKRKKRMSHLEEIKKYQEEVREEVERWVNSGVDVNEKNEVSDRQQS